MAEIKEVLVSIRKNIGKYGTNTTKVHKLHIRKKINLIIYLINGSV